MGGNVGIGTWAPTASLSVGTNSFTVSSAGAITAVTGITTSGVYTQSGTGINAFSGNVGIGSLAPGQALGDVQYPSACVFIGETDGSEAFANDGTNVHLGAGGTDWKTASTGANYRHNDGSNFAFVDGHVKWNKPNSVKCTVGDCWFSVSGL